MISTLEPLLAILAIVAPLGLAYVIVSLQSRKPACGYPKISAITCNDLPQKRTES